MKLCVKIFRATLLALLVLTLMGGTVFAAFSYYATIQVQETSGNPYDYLPIIAAVDNDYLSDNGYISLTGLDTRVLSGSTELKHLVVDDQVLFVAPTVGADSTGNYKYTLNNTDDLDSFPVIVGYNGYITISDHNDMLGAVADDGGDQTDETTAANNDTPNDMTLLPAVPAENDAYYFGYSSMFSTLTINIGTQGEGVWVITWEYWDSSAWEALSDVTDNTTGFTATVGNKTVTFTLPGDWATTTVESISAYWIRARVSAYTSKVTVPKGTQSFIGDSLELGDDFEIEFDGYVDTSSGSGKNLVYKEDAFICSVSDTSEISAGLVGVYNPDASVETTSVDGQVAFWDAGGQLWATAVADLGDLASDTDASFGSLGRPVGWRCDGLNDKYDSLGRAIFLFDTTGLPDGCTIISATFYLYGFAVVNTGAWDDTTANVYSSAPATDTAVGAGDYDSLGATAFCDTPIGIGDWSTVAYNAFEFNAAGLAAVSTTDITKLGVRTSYDVSGDDPGWTVAGHELCFGCYFADQAGTDKDPRLVVVYGVTAPGISSGVHTVKAYADEINLGIIVDEGEAGEVSDTTALGGASVTDNANDITINQNNVLPYFDYLKWTVSDTLIAWYQPICMITGTTLDDREGTDAGETGTAEEDATITWGGNPVGVSATIGSLISSSQPGITPAGEEDIVEVVPEGSIPSGGVVDVVALRDNPLYPVVAFATEYIDLTEEQIWFGGATLIILMGMGLAVGKVPNHLLLAGTIGLVLSGFFTAQGIYQWWMLLIFFFMFIASLISERKPVI